MDKIETLKTALYLETNDNLIDKNKIITFLNPYSYLFYRKNITLFSYFDGIYIDGISLVYLLRFLLGLKVDRCSFDMTSLAPIVFDSIIDNNYSVYFIGAKENEIKRFHKKIKNKHPTMRVLGFRNGYFDSKTDLNLFVKKLSIVNPDVVVVGMGTPNQEFFLFKLKSNGWNGIGFTCGGFFHQTAKKENYYPKFFNTLNLRWLYRIIDEPKLFKRYALDYPKAITIFAYDVIIHSMKNKSKEK